jgi:uncharacterized repeat protein (TIGR01451 family)
LAARLYSIPVALLLLLFHPHQLVAEGIPELKPSNDQIRLIINRTSDSGGGRTNFAGWDNPDPFSRLYINIQDPTQEFIYIGLGLSDLTASSDVNPEFDGAGIRYRLIAPNGTVVVDRFILQANLNIAGATDQNKFDNAKDGPSEITGAGYTAGPNFTISPTDFANAGVSGEIGDYYLELTEADANGNPINPDDGNPTNGAWDGFELEFFDFTVHNPSLPTAEEERKGRVWSWRWELTTTSGSIPFNGAFVVCDNDESTPDVPNDAFITRIDFNGVGFMPYAFNAFFNSNGVQNTGNPVVDRRSQMGENAQGTPEHMVFLNDPVDVCLTASFGMPTVDINIERCSESGPFAYCFLVTLDKVGAQLDILLDLNGTPGYQAGTEDVVLSKKVAPGEENDATCLSWDGLDGLGDPVDPATLDGNNVIISYMEGIFHFPIFDAETNSMSFNITYERPVPPVAAPIKLKWDDSEITDVPINGPDASSPVTCVQVNLEGCAMSDAGCTRCWTEFDYGDRATLNTFWTSLTQPLTFVPDNPGYYTCEIDGENELCLGDNTTLTAELILLPIGATPPDANTITYGWEGPDGPIPGADGPSISITNYDPAIHAGTYTVTIEFGSICSTTCSIVIGDSDACEADLNLDKSVNKHNPEVDEIIFFTVVLTNEGPQEATNIVVEDEIPNGYSMITPTDGLGVYNPATRIITWQVPSLPATPGSNTITFTYSAKVTGGSSYLNIVQITAADQDDPDSDPNLDETVDEDGDNDPYDDDEDFEIVCPTATLTISPANSSICVGAEATFSVTEKSGGAGVCGVSWLASTDNVNFTPTGAIGDTYTVPNTLDEGVYYYKAVYSCEGPFCQDAESNVATLTIVSDISATVENIIMGFDYATSETCENFDVIMDVEICNEDPTQIENLTVLVDLESESNGIFAGNVQILGLVDGDDVIPSDIFNPGFDGDDDQNLFKPGAASLEGNSCLRVRIRFEVAPDEAVNANLASTARFVSVVGASGCTSTTSEDDAVLGDCWFKSRIFGANDNINVTLDPNCKAVITPDMILENHYYACDTWTYPLGGFYRVRVLYPGQTEPSEPLPWVEVCASDFPNGMVIVYVENVGDDCHPAWGKVTLEDKSNPYFECAPEDITTISRKHLVQTADGLLRKSQGPLLNFSDYACFQDEVGLPEDCDSPYDVLEFYVSEPDFFTFEAWDPTGENDQVENDNELLLALFAGDFDPNQPCSNIIGQSNTVAEYGVIDGADAPDGRIRFSALLTPGVKYSLLVAQDRCDQQGDDYRIYALSDGDAEILDGDIDDSGDIDDDEPADNFTDPRPLMVEQELFCSDVDYILHNSDYTPNPTPLDNCDENPEVWFNDTLHDGGDCDEIYITRTWYIRDKAGNVGESCTQYIHFRRPGLEDVQKPPTTVPIECDELRPEWLDENGRPSPEIAGYPFVITAFGIKDLDEVVCNIGADYRDISVIDVCANTQKIVRQWIILDWCNIGDQWELNNSTLINWRQLIKTGDFTAPVVTIDNPNSVVSNGGVGCVSNLRISNVTVTDNCSGNYTVNAKVYRIIGLTEIMVFQGTEGDLVRNVQLGHTYRVDYEVEDDCGNRATASYTVTIEDMTAPVAVCNEDLNITLGGNGIGRLMDTDVDEGSWDNCELKDIYVSRKLANNAIRDAYLQEIWDLSFSDLELDAAAEDLDMNVDSEIWVRKSNGDKILRKKDGMWYTWWADDIWFVCLDPAIPVVVELLAEDVQGLTNMCWLTVNLEDKIAPVCEAPQNVTDLCTSLPYGFDPYDDDQLEDLFGMAIGRGNCADASARQTSKTVVWDCNSGTITRYFVAETAGGRPSLNDCVQTITISPVHDYELKFPKDVSADCEPPKPDTLLYKINACDLITVNVKDEQFDVISSGCYKIQRTYKVMNWCEYNGEDDPVVVARDHDCDGIKGNQDIYVLRRANGDVFFDRTDDETDSSPAAGSRGCSPANPRGYWEKNAQFGQPVTSTGYWQYTQYIKVEDTTPPEITITGEDKFCSDNNITCDAAVSIPFTITDLCPGSSVNVRAFVDGEEVAVGGSAPNFSIGGRYEIGEHLLEIRATDGCQQIRTARKVFEVVDCVAPSPVCINGLAVDLMPVEEGVDVDGDGDVDVGAFSIWASDFKVSGLEDCTGPVKLSINRVGETPAPDQAEIILTCEDPDTLIVELYAWDGADNPMSMQPDGTLGGPNYDHCITYLLVQDMLDLCGRQTNPAAISGLLTTQEGAPVESVDVFLTGGMTSDMRTGETGAYAFSGLTPGGDYTITPVRNDNHRNGVNTLDLIKVNKHILGSVPFTDPYQLIAADVNQSNSVTAMDLIHIRKLLLGTYPEFPGSRSWRFFAADHEFADPGNPWAVALPEVLNYNNVSSLIASGNFVAVKIGDVDGNAIPNSRYTAPRNLAGNFLLEVTDRELRAGAEYRIDFANRELEAIQGYQFTLRFDQTALELVDVEYELARAENFGFSFLEEGILTTSWNHSKWEVGSRKSEVGSGKWEVGSGKSEVGSGKWEVGSGKLFTLVFRAREDGRLSDLLRVNSRYTQAEAYDLAGDYLDVALTFDSAQPLNEDFMLYQNRPNPWRDRTIIDFHLPEADATTLTIYDVQGRVLKVMRANLDRGYHQVELTNGDLAGMAAGVLYYRLETSRHSATRKMIVLER